MPRASMNGHRAHVILTDPQLKRLRTMARKTSLSLSELLRRAVDAFLTDQKS